MSKVIRITDTCNENKNFYEAFLEKINLLTSEEEKALGLRIRQGDIKARNKLVEANLPFVQKCAEKYAEKFRSYQVPLEEIVSAGYSALIASADRFNPAFDNRFISYAVYRIRLSMIDFINYYHQIVHIPDNKIKDIKIHYKSLDIFNDVQRDDDEDNFSIQNRSHEEVVVSQPNMSYNNESEAMRHLLLQHLSQFHVNFLMDYVQCQMRSDLEFMAFKYDMTYEVTIKRIKFLLKKLKKLNLYTAYINQAA